MDKYNIKDKSSYILGVSLIVEAIKCKSTYVNKVYLSSKAHKNKELDVLLSLCDKYQIPYEENDLIIEKLSLKENCYGIGVIKKYQSTLQTDEHLVLYNFHDLGELGTVVRSAVSFNFKDIVLINSDIDIFDPKVIRASMGSFFHVNIKKYASLNEYLNEYKYNIYPFTGETDRELKTIKIKKPYSIIIPAKYHELDGEFLQSYYIKHLEGDVNLTSLCSIVFNYIYHLKRVR